MGYLDSLNITGSALTAERFRTDIILQNLANQNTTRTAEGGPYRRKQVVLRENQLDFKSELGKAMTKADRGGVYVRKWWRARILSFRCTIRIIQTPMRTGMS